MELLEKHAYWILPWFITNLAGWVGGVLVVYSTPSALYIFVYFSPFHSNKNYGTCRSVQKKKLAGAMHEFQLVARNHMIHDETSTGHGRMACYYIVLKFYILPQPLRLDQENPSAWEDRTSAAQPPKWQVYYSLIRYPSSVDVNKKFMKLDQWMIITTYFGRASQNMSRCPAFSKSSPQSLDRHDCNNWIGDCSRIVIWEGSLAEGCCACAYMYMTVVRVIEWGRRRAEEGREAGSS